MKNRVRVIGLLFAIQAIVLVARLFFWQVIKGGELSSQAYAQQTFGVSLSAARGDIYASDGSWLAASSEAWLLFATKNHLDLSNEEIANRIAPITVEEEGDDALLTETLRIQEALNREDAVWIPLKHRLSSEKRIEIENLEINGLGFDSQESRYYPESSSSAHLLGFVGKDDSGEDRGYFGLEGYYDLTLSGAPGFIEREFTAIGAPLLFGKSKEVSATGGIDLITHIDKGVQILVEEKLKEGIETYAAVSGNITVINPKDGGIMAMASHPGFDPRSYFDYSNDLFRNPTISDSFEPGSVFKPLIMAAALDKGVVTPTSVCDICDQPYKVDKYYIKTWNEIYNDRATMVDVIKNSDNVGMVFVGNKLGLDSLHEYIADFGIGEATGVDLQGEFSPVLKDKKDWNIVDQATATFGQGIAVTPIQLVNAVAAIANDGVRYEPQVVDKIRIDGWEQDIKPIKVNQVISKKAADQITDIMVIAAKQGEAKWAIPEGFNVAGKTGTAQIPVAGHYDEEKTIASYIGFAPPDNPKFVMLVTLREPQSSPWASETAAPLWFDIARELFPYLRIHPER